MDRRVDARAVVSLHVEGKSLEGGVVPLHDEPARGEACAEHQEEGANEDNSRVDAERVWLAVGANSCHDAGV